MKLLRCVTVTLIGSLAAACLSAQAPAAFEVASIRLRPPAKAGELTSSGQLRISGADVTGAMSVWDLISYGYSIRTDQRGSLPNWATTDIWEIQAKVPGDATPSTEQVRKMVQGLLADRFQLKLRQEMREISVYRLIARSEGVKLRRLADPSDPAVPASRRVARGDGVMEWAEGKWSLRSLIGVLSGFTDRPIVNMMGLADTDVIVAGIQFVPDKLLTAPNAPAGPSVFKAVEDQLGLRLEAIKMPREYFNIERVEKPSAN